MLYQTWGHGPAELSTCCDVGKDRDGFGAPGLPLLMLVRTRGLGLGLMWSHVGLGLVWAPLHWPHHVLRSHPGPLSSPHDAHARLSGGASSQMLLLRLDVPQLLQLLWWHGWREAAPPLAQVLPRRRPAAAATIGLLWIHTPLVLWL